METELKTFTDYCKDFIKDRLPDYLGTSVCTCDLGYKITEGIDCTRAKEYLNFWFDDVSDYFQYEKDNFGENRHNPFESPEAYMARMIIEGVNSLLLKSKIIEDNWDNDIELTNKNIEKIIKEIEGFEVEF